MPAMASKDWSEQLDAVNFRCGGCRHAWSAVPDLIEPSSEERDAFHPWRYFANCPVCEREHQPQAAWEKALMKAHQASTGPRTAEGLAKVGKNLEGHGTTSGGNYADRQGTRIYDRGSLRA